MDSMEAPKKKTKPNPLSLDESLPDDIIITILAKVPRCNYPFLSLVSKNFRSLIFSRDLSEIRSSLGTTENTVFVRLLLPTSGNLCWYNLWKNPKWSKHLLVPINLSYNTVNLNSFAFLDSVYYVIGGHAVFSRTIKRYCRKTSSWLRENAPSMNVARKNAVVHLFGDKIYVMGGCNDSETTNWAEVFDTKTQTWKSFTCPDVLRGYKIYKIQDLASKLYVWTDTKDYSYDVDEDKWKVLEERLSRSKTWCVVDKIVYLLDHSIGFRWFDSQQNIWRKVKGLSRLDHKYGIRKSKGMIEIIEDNQKLFVFWDNFEKRGRGFFRNKKIWCAEISLNKRVGEMWGKIEWIDDVLRVSSSYDLVSCLSRSL